MLLALVVLRLDGTKLLQIQGGEDLGVCQGLLPSQLNRIGPCGVHVKVQRMRILQPWLDQIQYHVEGLGRSHLKRRRPVHFHTHNAVVIH